MKKYRYVEFVDGLWNSRQKDGKLFIVVPDPIDYIEEFSLEKYAGAYFTTLEHMGALGWELAFVTPCGNIAGHGGQMIQNAYVFKKELEE